MDTANYAEHKHQIAHDKMVAVMQGRYWIPDREAWLAAGRSIPEVVMRVDFCGVWGDRHRVAL